MPQLAHVSTFGISIQVIVFLGTVKTMQCVDSCMRCGIYQHGDPASISKINYYTVVAVILSLQLFLPTEAQKSLEGKVTDKEWRRRLSSIVSG